MLPLKTVQARKRGGVGLLLRRPGLAQLPTQRLQPFLQAPPTRRRSLLQIDHRQRRGLGFAQQLRQWARIDPHRQHQLARGHRHTKLCQAPLGGGIGLTADHKDRRTQLQVLKQLITPALANIDAVLLIDIEKEGEVALFLLSLLLVVL